MNHPATQNSIYMSALLDILQDQPYGTTFHTTLRASRHISDTSLNVSYWPPWKLLTQKRKSSRGESPCLTTVPGPQVSDQIAW